MRFLRIAAVLILVLLVTAAAMYGAARLHDGPFGLVAGGALSSGEWELDPAADVRFAHDLTTIECQLLTPARSRTTWVVEHEGRLFVPSGYMNGLLGKIWKHWPHEAVADGRVVVRMNGKRYARQLVRITDGPELVPVVAELSRKYGMPATEATVASGALWLFELAPRQPDVAELQPD